MIMMFPDLAPFPEFPHAEPAIFYGRMSHLDDDLRIADQFARARTFTRKSQGAYYIALAFADDGISAWREDSVRPEFENFLKALTAGPHRIVIVWQESRITRDPVVGANFGRIMHRIKGTLIVTDGETETVYHFTRQRDRDNWHDAVGKSVSESGTKSELIRRTFEVKRERREFRGGPVGFGWRVEWTRRGRKVVGVWTVDEAEGAVLREASARVRRGETVLTIADDFYDRGIRIRTIGRGAADRKHGILTAKTLSGYLRNPRIAGLYATGSEKTGWHVEGEFSNFPAILGEDEWRETVAALAAGPKRRATGNRVTNTFASYYVCFSCERSLVRNTPEQGKGLWRHRLGAARSGVECDYSFSIPAGEADQWMTDLIDEYLRARTWERHTNIENASELRAQRLRVESDLAGLPKAVAAKTVSLQLAGRVEREYRAQLTEIDAKMARQARLSVVLDGDEAVRQWRSNDLTHRRRVLSTILERVVVKPGQYLPLQDRLHVEWKMPAFPND